MIPMVLEWVGEQGDGWLLDGFPRTVPQVEALDSLLEVKPLAIILHVSDDELRRRVSCRLECVECHRVAREGEGHLCLNVGVNLNLELMMRRRILKIVWLNIAVWSFLL